MSPGARSHREVMNLDDEIARVVPHAIELRHRLHQVPELSYEEVETAKIIRAELDRLGIEYVGRRRRGGDGNGGGRSAM